MRKLVFASLLTLLFATASWCADPMIERDVKHLETSRDFTIRVAEQMPEADFGFKLTPAQMSFAQQMVHIAESNVSFFSALAGEKEPFKKPSSMGKKEVISYLNRSFNYCIGVLQKATPAQMEKKYPVEGGQMTGWDVVMLAFDHTTHHRAQCEMYLRAKGITPTQYKA